MIVVSERHCWLRRMLGRRLVPLIVYTFESHCYNSASLSICKNVPLCNTKPRACFESSTLNVQSALSRIIANDNPVANFILT
jgi:hypothetical protein